MNEGRGPSVYTIPPHRAFADALAAGLIARHGKDKTGLAGGIVLVPNNRAARAISDAFVRRSEGGLLLPRLVPVGDPDLDERIGGALEPLESDPIPPAVEPMTRLMILARLVESHMPGVDAAEALRLAADLGRALDQLLVEEIDPARLFGIVEEAPDLSAHWQASLDRLRLILEDWPRTLRRLGRIDLADRRNRLLDAMAKRWRREPPPGFVVGAGITTTAPAVARLLGVIARLPNGTIVFPGLDRAMPEAEWQALGPHEADPETGRRARSIETHPQYALKLLLDRMSVGRGEVVDWRWGGGRDAPASRSRAIANAMAPARYTGKWQSLRARDRSLSGVKALEVADPAQEAQAIAILLREAVETPGRTAALVTPDRMLARRVSALLERWNIVADDSAGRPLGQTPPGTLLLAIAEAAAERFAPVPLLALLKHPLVRRGEARQAWLEGVRYLDLALRGPRPAAGLSGIAAHLAAVAGREAPVARKALDWWHGIAPLLAPLEQGFDTGASLAQRFQLLRETAEALAGAEAWAGPAGRAAADLFEEIEVAALGGPRGSDMRTFPALLTQILSGVAVRPPYGQHPRIFIWGLIEARLQQADLMILSGLNEGTWPSLPAPDPWLAPRIRADLGLPGLDRRIGLAAHDFASGLGGRQVVVTRARRDARAPAVASRFWLRLEAMTGGMTRLPAHRRWAEALDRPDRYTPASRPAPQPPAVERPSSISVTDVDRLKADPFAFYARKMLGLSMLEEVDADPGPAWRGSAVHAILEAWAKEDGCDPAKLRPRAEALLAGSAAHPLMKALWQPRLLEAVDWIAEEVARLNAEGRKVLAAECKGRAQVAGIDLFGVADRIDRAADGGLTIVDYKTGMPPASKAVAAGYALQLGLIGLIAERGGFEGIEGKPEGFEYWSLAKKGGRLGFIASPVGGKTAIDPADFTALAAANFADAAAQWLTGDAPFTAKLHPEYAPYGDYDQLMRLDEWYGRED
ncbi:double-strand break repair protein AddB [Allosphingosinicella flava]|uniref:Double-strand break repair protein AddB n=1 Tax=Allosphingosinicella flava TaxID=2771430 RepID=A0A7T2LMN7_9SPHN|nr:double-strand break repair protein AddB [Sphingosinicella flava]QPQ55779.1 double-strand break repair protein AddB [Sphingosinicella flava]